MTSFTTQKGALIDRSPLVFGVTVVAFLLALWHAPISLPYLAVAAAVGLLLGCGFLFTYATAYGDLMLTICPLFLIVIQIAARYLLLSSAQRDASSWSVALQFFALAYAIVFSFAWIFRGRLISLHVSDAQQIVEPERRERLSHQA
jgi:prepilin signal peptidase PulO-like enzyme (type II secretory pathway)